VNDQTDGQLLRVYAEHRTDSVFAELVRRHLDFVYSAALRMVCDAHLAEDMTQGVFVALANNAARLADRANLCGWLHKTAQNIAAQTVRTIERRRAREREAVAMNQLLSSTSEISWEQIAPHLDAALGELGEPDRDALFLRYFKNYDLRTVGTALGISDDAAQKRVSRAVGRLREFLAKRGITVGAGVLTVVISANAVQAAPVGLAATITATAIAGTAVSTSAAIATTKTVAMTTIQKVFVTATVAVLAGAGIYEARQASHRQEEVQVLRQSQDSLLNQLEELRNQYIAATNAQSLARDQFNELVRLRGEIGNLRSKAKEVEMLREENRRIRSAQASGQNFDDANRPKPGAQQIIDKASWAFVGYATPEDAFQSATWAMTRGDLKTLLNSATPEAQKQMIKDWEGKSENELVEQNVNGMTNVTGYRVLGKIAVSENEVNLLIHTEGEDLTPTFIMQKVGNEWKIANRVKYTPF
jgi:RNA polymerase sigma factor (sigma-70 family)